MKKRSHGFIFFIMILACGVILPCLVSNAQEILRYSCSAQIFETFGMKRLDAYTKETGIKVDLNISSSASAVYRLMNDFSDIAGAAEKVRFRYKEFGYLEFPFCKDPLAVIANTDCPVENLNKNQVRDIFGGHIKNWKEVGGPDEPITVVVPADTTAAYKNFSRIFMEENEIIYDFMSYRSTMVIAAVRHFPCAISFIAHGAIRGPRNLRMIKIDGLSPTDRNYPYYQTFYYVTKGEPVGAVKKFIDFTMSEKGQAFIKAKGMIPLSMESDADPPH